MRIRQRYLWLALGGALVAIALAVFLGGRIKSASAQSGGLSTGATVIFVVPAGTPINAVPNSDVVIYIAQPTGSTVAVNCVTATDQHPIQTVAAVDPEGVGGVGGSRGTRLTGLITLSVNGTSQTSPIPNGTKVGNLALNCGVSPCCTIASVPYDTWKGTVQ